MPAPMAPEELAALDLVQKRYVVLINNLKRANEALGAYLRETRPSTQP